MRRQPATAAAGSDCDDPGALDLCELSRHKGVWERVVGQLEPSVTRVLGETCKMMYESILSLPWSSFVDDSGQAVYAPILHYDDQNAYADHCHWLLLQLHDLFDKSGRLCKRRQGYKIVCHEMQRQQSVVAHNVLDAVHQTMHFYNLAQINRKMDELKNELEKMGRDVVQGPSEADAPASPKKRRAPKRKAAKVASVVRACDTDMVAADMTVKQLHQALKYYHVLPPPSAKKPALVKMLDKARDDSVTRSSRSSGGVLTSSVAGVTSAAANELGTSRRKKRQPPAAVAQKRNHGSSTATAPASNRKKRTRQDATGKALTEHSKAATHKENEEDDPVLRAGEMAATAVKQLSYSDLMKACEVRGLDPWQGREDLCAQLTTHAKEQAAAFASKTASELKETCAELSMQTSGNKAVLVSRLVDQQWRALSVTAAGQ